MSKTDTMECKRLIYLNTKSLIEFERIIKNVAKPNYRLEYIKCFILNYITVDAD